MATGFPAGLGNESGVGVEQLVVHKLHSVIAQNQVGFSGTYLSQPDEILNVLSPVELQCLPCKREVFLLPQHILKCCLLVK